MVQPKSAAGAFMESIGLSKKSEQVDGAAISAHNLAEVLIKNFGLKAYVLHTPVQQRGHGRRIRRSRTIANSSTCNPAWLAGCAGQHSSFPCADAHESAALNASLLITFEGRGTTLARSVNEASLTLRASVVTKHQSRITLIPAALLRITPVAAEQG